MVTEVNSKNQLVERNFKRNEMLAEYFFGLSKMVCSGIGIGALSPLFTGEAMGVTNIVCMGCAVIAAACFAYAGNYLLKVELKRSNYGNVDNTFCNSSNHWYRIGYLDEIY